MSYLTLSDGVLGYRKKMPKLVISLTDSKIKSAISIQKKSFEKNTKLSDGGGLYLLLDKKGGAYWCFDYVRPISKKRATILRLVFIRVVHYPMLVQNEVSLESYLLKILILQFRSNVKTI